MKLNIKGCRLVRHPFSFDLRRSPSWKGDTFCFQETWGMSLNFPAVAYTLYSRVITTFLFAKVASAGMTAKHRCPIFLDSIWQTSHFITKMGIPYTLPKNYLLFIPMALTAFLGKEKVYTRQDMGIKKSSHESSNRTKEKCLTTLRKSINFWHRRSLKHRDWKANNVQRVQCPTPMK